MSAITWDVLPPFSPFGVDLTPLGQVQAPDKPTALQRARFRFGRDVVVISALERAQASREKHGPGVVPKQQLKPRGPRSDRYRQFAAAKRAQAKAPPVVDDAQYDFSGKRGHARPSVTKRDPDPPETR